MGVVFSADYGAGEKVFQRKLEDLFCIRNAYSPARLPLSPCWPMLATASVTVESA